MAERIGNCGDCKGYQKWHKYQGDCKMNPPISQPDGRAIWPLVWSNDWCLAFKSKAELINEKTN